MSLVISLLCGHLLSVIESELIKEEPEIVSMIETELKLLITKIQYLLEQKSPAAAAVLNPALTEADNLANTGIEAGATAIMGEASNG